MVDAAGNWARGYLRSMLSEKDGTGSSSRLCLVLVVVFTLGFISALVWKIHAPITVPDFCQAVGALGTFVLSTVGVLYGINRLGNFGDNKAATGSQPGAQQ